MSSELLPHIMEIKQFMGEARAVMSNISDDVASVKADIKESSDKHDKRLTSLEHDRTRVKAWAAAGTFAGTVIGWLGSLLGGKV